MCNPFIESAAKKHRRSSEKTIREQAEKQRYSNENVVGDENKTNQKEENYDYVE